MKPKILVVEDERSVLAVTVELLKRVNCEVIVAVTAADAIVRLEQEAINLLITDFYLGDQTSASVIRALKRCRPAVPVILVTGSIEGMPNWLQEPGAVEHIFEKPYSTAKMLEAVREALAAPPFDADSDSLAGPDTVSLVLPRGIEETVHRVVDQENIVAITDKKGAIVYANDRFCEISGYNRSELLGRNHRLLKSGQHPPAFYKTLWGTILDGRVWRGEICNKAKDGHLYYEDTIIAPLRSEGLITHFLALRTDITAKKEIEKELAWQQKREEEERRMAALGRMANGFLHDLNNILTGVMGLATEASSVVRDTMLHDAIGRMAQLTRTLRDYSTGRPAKPEPFPLNPLLSCACSLVRHRKGISESLVIVEQTAGTHQVEVVGNEGQIFEVVLNLVVNAAEATTAVPHPKVVLCSSMEGHNVVVTVEDNGPGVPAALARNLFEPYTSTKGLGRGIGLSVSRSITLAHKGDLQLARAGGGGEGARFRLTLPAREAVPILPVANEVPACQKHVVLVSEDEASVRSLIARGASQIGLTVMNTGDTADLLALAAQMKEVLAAAIIDSCEVDSEHGAVASLRRISSGLPIILISARLTSRGQRETPWGMVESIPKPFEAETLIRALNATVASNRARVTEE